MAQTALKLEAVEPIDATGRRVRVNRQNFGSVDEGWGSVSAKMYSYTVPGDHDPRWALHREYWGGAQLGDIKCGDEVVALWCDRVDRDGAPIGRKLVKLRLTVIASERPKGTPTRGVWNPKWIEVVPTDALVINNGRVTHCLFGEVASVLPFDPLVERAKAVEAEADKAA